MCVCRAFRFRLFRVFRGDPPLGPTLEMAPTKPIVPGNKPSSTQHLNQKRGAVGAKTNPIFDVRSDSLGRKEDVEWSGLERSQVWHDPPIDGAGAMEHEAHRSG